MFLDHLLELRTKILVCVAAIVVGALVAHYYHDPLIRFLLKPTGDHQLFFLSPMDPLFFILKIDLFGGIILAFPVINWCILGFIRPAMHKSGWLMLCIIYFTISILALCGLGYAFFVIIPISLQFLLSINIEGIQNMITANSYLDFLLTQSFIIAAIFQIPIFILAGTYMRALNVKMLSAKRPYVYVIGIAVLAMVTPTVDIFNLLIVAVPAAIIYEGSIVAARILQWSISRKVDKKQAHTVSTIR